MHGVTRAESEPEGFELGQRRQRHVVRIWNIPKVNMDHWQTKVVAVLPGMGWIPWGRSTKERIVKDWRHLKGQIHQRLPSLLQFFPKAKFGIRFRSIQHMRSLCSRAVMMLSASSTRDVESTQLVMAIETADQIASSPSQATSNYHSLVLKSALLILSMNPNK